MKREIPPGETFVLDVPNAGHDLGDEKQAMVALSALYGHTLTGKPYPLSHPSLSYSKKEIKLKVNTTPDMLVDAILWSANSTHTDFRDETWEGKSLELKKKNPVVSTTQAFPGCEYTESTRLYIADDDEVFVK